ncbi:MAG: hypothetical protein IKV44_03890 [Clostridia bacterium]|nr:hypothetical protein [Clostridia bacterium]
MNKNKGMIILSIILAIQLVFPLSLWAYETYKNNELEEKGQEIKVLVDWVSYDENKIKFGSGALESAVYSHDNRFVVFEEKENGYEIPVVTDSTETDFYIGVDRLYSLYREKWCFMYETKTAKAQNENEFFWLYNKDVESENIRKGTCEGPGTQAYAVMKIYRNRIKVINVYIDETPVDTVIEKYNNNQFDAERYEYDIFEPYEDYSDENIEEYPDLTDANGEYVTVPVTE